MKSGDAWSAVSSETRGTVQNGVATLVLLWLTWAYWPSGWQGTWDQWLALAACFAQLVKARWPLIALCTAGVAAAVSFAVWPLVYLAWWLVFVRRLWLATLLVALPIVLAMYGFARRTDLFGAFVQTREFGPILLVAVAAVLGAWMRERGRVQNLLHERIDMIEQSHTTRERDIRVAERMQLAAEMHDVVAHRLSIVALHSAVLARRSGSDPGLQARLLLVQKESALAIEELGEVLSSLRTTEVDAEIGLEPVELNLEKVVKEAEEAGQIVNLKNCFRSDNHTSAQLLSIKRVLREGLTNARKYSSDMRVGVEVLTSDKNTRIELSNSYTADSLDSGTGTGSGLAGLAERVRIVGGSIAATSRDGQYVLLASIPCTHDAEMNNR